MGRTRTGGKRMVAVLAALAVAASVPGVAEAQTGPQGGCTPGAPGIGDDYYPNYGNGGYDARYYEIDLTYDPATDAVDASTWIEARATQSLCSFNLDFVGLNVRGVWVNDRPATWTRDDHELTVTPRRPLRQGQRFNVTVDYDGVPTEFSIPGFDVRTGFMATPEGATVVGQPEVAAGWFPVNDHPLDKAAYRFDITVPNGYEVAANGYLLRQRTRGDSTTWTWDAPDPMASYLATIDISDWDVSQWRTESGLPVYDAVDTRLTGGLRQQIDSSLARQGEILDLLEGAFGPYPFGTIGAIVPNQDDFLFALETQTRPVYSKLFWLDNAGNPVNGDFVVVHELAHQWFGDDVALARWQDIWLNEGFATYAEWLWEEYEGRGTPQEIFRATYDSIPADDQFWSVVIGDPGVEFLFDNAVYVRGAMTLQALRLEVGDDAFWEIVRTWAATKSGGHGTTPEFIALAEEISGQQLDAVFDTWLFTAGKPPFPEAASAAGAESAATQAASAEAQATASAWLADFNRRLAQGRF